MCEAAKLLAFCKTHQGGIRQKNFTAQSVIMPKTGTENCPYATLEKYLEHKPDTAHFYCRPTQPKKGLWYTRQPVGKNTFPKMIKEIAELAGINTTQGSGRVTGHSLRRSSIQAQMDKGVPNDVIMSQSRHSSEASLQQYAAIPLSRRLEATRALDTLTQPDTSTVTTTTATTASATSDSTSTTASASSTSGNKRIRIEIEFQGE